MNSVRLSNSDDLAHYLFEWSDDAADIAVTRYDTGPPKTYIISKADGRILWRTLLGAGYQRRTASTEISNA